MATFLFCDMTGSTTMGERLDPESVRAVVMRYFERMRRVIERHGGTVDKFIGDAVVAIFGVPTVREDDALRAVRAAVEMQEEVARLNEELENEFASAIAVRIGVNTGEVVAGGTTAQQTIVLGDAVNLAARLEQAAEPGNILIGERTFQLVRHNVTATRLQPLAVKGKAEAVTAYRLESTSAAGRARTHSSSLVVGRDNELGVLEALFEDTCTKTSCRLATIVAPAGIGKSHLAAHFVARIGKRARTFRGHCLSYGDGITFWPVSEIVREAAGVDPEDSPELARSRIGEVVRAHEHANVVADRVAQATGILSGSAPAEEIAWALRLFFEALARDVPLILVVEDVHWAEPALLMLLRQLPDLSSDAAILVICLARPELLEHDPQWPTTVQLGPLDVDEAAALIAKLLPEEEVPDGLARRIVAASSGNPLFLEELVQMLLDDGFADVGEVERLALPPTINALLSARLDRLPQLQLEALERGSVEGTLFHRPVLEMVASMSGGAIADDSLSALVQKEFVAPARAAFADEDAFEFLHILVRETAYERTPKKLRADLHGRIADWLTQRAGARLAEYEELVGYHLEQSFRLQAELAPVGERERDLASRAAAHLASSARRARLRGDVVAARKFLTRTLALVADDAKDRSRLLVELASALMAGGDFPAAEAALEQARELALARADGTDEASADLELRFVRVLVGTASAESLLESAEKAVVAFDESDDVLASARARHKIAFAHLVSGRYGLCARALQLAYERAEAGGGEVEKTPILNMLGMALWFGPVQADIAVRHLERLLAESDGQPVRESSILAPLAGLLAMDGRFAEAQGAIERTRGILEALGLKSRLAETALVAASVGLLAGDMAAAERALRDGYLMLEAMGERAVRSTIAASLAGALCMQNRDDEAEDFLDIGEAIAAADDVVSQARLKVTRARILARRRSTAEASQLAREAVELLHDTDALDERASTLVGLGEVLLLAGEGAEACSRFEQALRLYRTKGNRVAADLTAATLDRAQAVVD